MYVKHIDGLRALAVMLVFFGHLELSLFSGGFVGVDVFFVISGFLITNNIVNQLKSSEGFSFLNFYERRIRRIVPALLFTLILSFIAAVGLLNAGAFRAFGKSLIWASLSVSNIFFNQHSGYFDIFAKTSPLLHTWSLAVEEQFYIIYPILLFIAYQRWYKNIALLLTALFMISFGLNLLHQYSHPTAIYYLTQYRVFEFCIGAFLIYLRPYSIQPMLQELLCLIGTGLILTSAVYYNATTLFPSYHALLPALGAALIILTGQTKYSGFIFKLKPIRAIGLISYSLYLVHWPLITFLKTYHEDCGQDFSINAYEKLALVMIAIILATFMYHFIEQPFRRSKTLNSSSHPKSWIPTHALKSITQGLSAAGGVLLLGILVGKSHGWLWRVSTPEAFKDVKDPSLFHQQMWGGADFEGGWIYKGKTSYPSIVMMGDSHAGMLDEGLVKELGISHHLTIFTASGGGAGKYYSSLLIPGITRLDNKDQKFCDDSARTAYKEALAMLHQTDQPNVLILSAAWASQLSISGDLKHHQSFKINPNQMKAYQDYAPLWQGLDRLVARLKNKKLILIGEVPGSRFNAVQCLGGVKWFRRSDCHPYDPVSNNQAALNMNRVLAEYAAKRDNVYFINPYDYFCKHDQCDSVNEHGEPFYSDGAHLSKVGSRFVVERMRGRVLELLRV